MAVNEAKAQDLPKLAKWLRRVRSHTTSLHWACEDRDREGLLRGLRSNEFERALPPLAELEKIAHRGKTPVCERSLRLLRLASLPWDILFRHVAPRSFREHITAVIDITRGRGGDPICFTILSFCSRGWWAGQGPVLGDARVPPPVPVAKVLRRLLCDNCQQCPMWRATELRRCSGCRAVYYCTRVDEGGRAACQHEAWGGHRKACKQIRKEAEAVKLAKQAADDAEATQRQVDEEVARAEAAKLAKAKRQAARKKEQKRRKKQQAGAGLD
jgi:hypothetical protein